MRLLSWILAASGILGLLALGSIVLEPWHECGRHDAFTTTSFNRGFCRGGERNGPGSLKTIASAQADFRGNDRDGNRIQDFWRGDISGLYSILPEGSSEMVKLIELSVAGADDSPLGKGTVGDTGPGQVAQDNFAVFAPKAGYFFRALRHADEDPGALDTRARFAACAYPSNYPASGRKSYIVSEGSTIYARDLGRPGPPAVFPDEETLKREWSKLD